MWMQEVAPLLLVGALWGCTNPWMRLASLHEDTPANQHRPDEPTASPVLRRLCSIRVWMPFLLNQAGSLVFNATLSQSDLSIAVPACNALALVFSVVTSYWLGERVNQPWLAYVGSMLVMLGVAICVDARNNNSEGTQI